jgi:hypothetical protein
MNLSETSRVHCESVYKRREDFPSFFCFRLLVRDHRTCLGSLLIFSVEDIGRSSNIQWQGTNTKVCCLRLRFSLSQNKPLLTFAILNLRLAPVFSHSTPTRNCTWRFSFHRQYDWNRFRTRHICSRSIERFLRLGHVVAHPTR